MVLGAILMREATTQRHQASGLVSLARARSARLVAMVRHGDDTAELPLLWRLCMSWVTLGYPVTVLDAGDVESADNPGLAQLLECPYRAGSSRQEVTAWNVFPAAIGLNSLHPAAGGASQLAPRLAHLFANDGVVVVYGNADTLLNLLPDTPLQPLMVVSSTPQSLLTSYQALKRLLAAGQLAPLVVDPSPTKAGPQTKTKISAAAALADCAKNFLGCDLTWIRLQAAHEDNASASDLQRMALRILENALPLSNRWTHMASAETKMGARHFSRSH